MVEIHGDAYAIGGDGGSGNDEESSIHQLSCSSGLCSWTTLNQQLKTGIYILAKPEYPNGLIIELCTLIIISKTEGFSPKS